MTTSPATWDGPLPFVPNDLGTLKAALRELPAEVAASAWEKGSRFPQWTIRPRSQPMDYYDPDAAAGAGAVVCRPATWTCLQTPQTRTLRRFFPVLLRAVDGCDPNSNQMEASRKAAASILGLDWSPLARYVWDGNAGFATEQTTPTDANTLANAALTTNVATITTVAAHGLTSGDQVVIASASLDSTFNGTYTVTVTGATTFTYPRTHANIGSGASTGTVFKVGGQWRSPNPALVDAATVSGTHNPIAAVARLTKAAREAGYRGQLWFHAPEWLVFAYGNAGMLTQSGSTLMLPGGHVLIADPAYPGTGLDGLAMADAETWIYATPPMFGAVRAVKAANIVNYDPNALASLGCSFVQWAIAQTVGIAMWDQEFVFGTKTYYDATHGSAT